MNQTAPPHALRTESRSQRRNGVGDAGLFALLVVGVLGTSGWYLWGSFLYDRDLERRWALPHEAKALAEEEIALVPRAVTELAERDATAATRRYEQALDTIRADLASRRASGELSAADEPAERKRATSAAQNCLAVELDTATAVAERLAEELNGRTAERRLELRRNALALVAEWEELFARHPEWPPHRLTAED